MKVEEPAAGAWDASKEPLDLGARDMAPGATDRAPGATDEAGGATDAALAALLESGGAHDAERRAERLHRRLARLDALNVGGMLAAATEGGGAELARALDAALLAGGALAARLRRCEELARPAAHAVHARSGAARADSGARALLRELHELLAWLDAPALRDLDALQEIPLGSEEGRARALAACEALRDALRAEAEAPPHRRRLAAVRERLRRLARAREQLTASVARHVNNVLVHLGNEAAAGGAGARAHGELLPLAPLMGCLRALEPGAHAALARVYAAWRARALERDTRAALEAARAALPPHAPPDAADEPLDAALTTIEALCDAEQDFCERFFFPEAAGAGEGSEAAARARAAEARRYMAALFPGLEAALQQLAQQLERHDEYGAARVLAALGRRVLAAGGGERWGRGALAGAAVAAKRQAERAVHERAARLAGGAPARRGRCGVLPAVLEFEEAAAALERILGGGGRRAELERWVLALGTAAAAAVARAEHPRTPRAVVQLENYHRLHGALAARRAPALDALRRECRARYEEALRAYVTQYFGRPLERVTAFFERVAEAVALGCREEEVRYRRAFSKHEARRALAAHPAAEVRRALHRLYRTVDKHLSEEGGLLQVVWRAMQEEFLAQHRALQARIAACYPAAGLALPLSTQDILDAFSDIAREH